MGASYHQFCPVAKAMELLDERWTMLVLRELMAGSGRFNDLRRGLPRMSPALLSKRLQHLTAVGLIRNDDGRYVLTEAGFELAPIVEAIAVWGVRWIGEIGDADLDPKLLLWDMHRRVDHGAVPPGRSVVHFDFTDVSGAARYWWLIITAGEADVCDADPGFDVTVTVNGTLRRLTEVWRGDVSWQHAQRDGALRVYGPEHVRRTLPSWFTLAPWASTTRPA
ncbi:winged helix-turn-helix transcriptional regulator [Dactylosporangium sp. NPDC051541]|uniref:winged helix-turn-helix transcriptional regulator n=1 Tax=Dactylosporangium sp. NPDC051541 TaxID=3363977 RepID=UPI0037B643C1